MEIGKCFLCQCKCKCVKEQVDDQNGNIVEDGQEKSNINLQGVSPIKNQLEVIHLLRKVLEIPQDVCCNFLRDFGDPSSWINCCDSCSLLITESKSISDQLIALQNHYKILQDKIKDIIIQSAQFDEFNGDQSKWRVKDIARSFITQGIKPKQVKIEDFSFENPELVTISTPSWNADLAHNNYIEENDSSISQNLQFTTDFYVSEDHGHLNFGETDDEDVKFLIKEECINSFINEDTESQEINEMKHVSDMDEYRTENENIDVSPFISVQLTEAVTKRGQDNEKSFKCDICGRRFIYKRSLNKHKKKHKGEILCYCSYCGKSFTRFDKLTKHKLTHAQKLQRKCSLCGMRFARPEQLNKHKLIHSGRKRYVCQFCGKSFWQHFRFTNHLRLGLCRNSHGGENLINVVRTEQKPYKHKEETVIKEESCPSFVNEEMECQEMNDMSACDEYSAVNKDMDVSSFVSVSLTEEDTNQSQDNEFKCDICGRGFIYKRSLEKHKINHKRKELHCCSYCGESFTGIDDLKKHKFTHTRRKGHKCSECEKCFEQISQLEQHELTHTGKKPHRCWDCGKCFASLHYLLTGHKKTHQKRYMCKFCGKGFWQDSSLENHLKVCKKSPSERHQENATIVVPDEEKPFLCKFCGLGFENSNTLTDHERTHRGRKTYKCLSCGRSFPNGGILKIHYKRSHKIETVENVENALQNP